MTTVVGKIKDRPSKPTVGIFISPELLEDWLDHIDISFDAFLDEMMGSWIFGYIESLKLVDVQPVMLCVSNRISTTTCFRHRPTGTVICVLPATGLYKVLCSARQFFKDSKFKGAYWIKGGLRILCAYLSTPLRSFWQELRRQRYAAILVQDYETARFDLCVLLGRLSRVPVYGTFQGAMPWRKQFHFLRSQTVQGCAGLIVAAEMEAERVTSSYALPSSKVARIYNPLDLTLWRPGDKSHARDELGIPHNAEVAIWHGRISLDYKGLDTLIEAWAHVCKLRSTSDLRLILIGTGPDSDELDSLIKKKQAQGIVRINRWIHDTTILRKYLGCADVFVFASRGEGFPVAPMEAMACGLPVVTSDASGMQDILKDGWNSGGIVVPRNDPHRLSVEIARVLSDTAWREELGKRARGRVEAVFSMRAIGPQLANVLLDSGAGEYLPSEAVQ